MVQLLSSMDPNYSYYTATSTGQEPSSGHQQQQQQHLRHQQIHSQAYARPPEHPSSASHAYAYPHGSQMPPPVPASYSSYPPPQSPQHASPYHSTPPQGMNATLPPLVHSQGYPRSGSAPGERYDAAFVPSIGPTLQDLPFTVPRSSSAGQIARNGESWGAPHASSSSRSQPHYSHRGMPASPTYPPSRHGGQHPSLSHSTQLIPTPAQTVQTYHGYNSGSSSPGGSMPVVASIPPASSGAVPPQERYYCDKCDKSFGRAHDKKRHYESAHLQTHHECRFCHKCFSRNDSLKRHQDNGCEKDPSFHS
ncbi:hypothetical protein BD414DRAFT_480896 [Trametes punicea]|nr:hypothetical protein BD414DRAFT_480896 [Trametes punicea]